MNWTWVLLSGVAFAVIDFAMTVWVRERYRANNKELADMLRQIADAADGPPASSATNVVHIETPEQADEVFGVGSELAETTKAMIYAHRGEIDPRQWPRGAVACERWGTSVSPSGVHTMRATFRTASGEAFEATRSSNNGRWWSDWERA